MFDGWRSLTSINVGLNWIIKRNARTIDMYTGCAVSSVTKLSTVDDFYTVSGLYHLTINPNEGYYNRTKKNSIISQIEGTLICVGRGAYTPTANVTLYAQYSS